MNAAALALENVSLAVGTFALRDISLALASGEILVLLGPNGAGKSVILETIAGFHRPLHGRVKIGGRDVTALPPEARHVGYVFQNFALFPHLTVAQNLRFATEARGGTRAGSRTREQRIAALLERFGLGALADRRPADLSGGEKQRVALARALATDPAVFLFDEPFSALDAATRDALRDELAGFLREARVPAVYVTHDYAEAMALADQVAVVDAGAIVQSGPAEDVYAAPRTVRIARLLGVDNIVDGEVRARIGDSAIVALGTSELRVPLRERAVAIGQRVSVSIRAEELSLLPAGQPRAMQQGERQASGLSRPDFTVPAKILWLANHGPLVRVACDCGFPLTAYVTRAQCRQMALAPDLPLAVTFPPDALNLLAG
ncbi:MAG TPA: ABC transporter ATP-binding protein [Casimicrobiaceae bacterium]|nr:ABC transporter ATP-binding protein [Casimicrobiaceae bacterium]